MAEFEDISIEPVDPSVLMQFSRYDNFGNVIVKIHRRDGRYDRRVLKVEHAKAVMAYLAQVLVEDLRDIEVQIPI